jgi:hypothetical protein
MQRETKSAKIMRLYAHGIFTDQEIADAVGCSKVYVRVVARQRKGGSESEYDRRYRASQRGKAVDERQRARHKEKRKAYQRELYRTKDHAAARAAYHKAKEAAHA